MSEYKRFIAYFYEYINGEKQKNAGFAKVELRNGMWRILFRLTILEPLEAPIQVFGFAREGGYLLGIPLGSMNTDCNAPEEWAWRADTPIGKENYYYFEQMNGIRIASGDGREFFTVWDDEPMDPGRFVMELPGEAEQPESAEAEKPEESGEPELPEKSGQPGELDMSKESGRFRELEILEESGQPRRAEQTEMPEQLEESGQSGEQAVPEPSEKPVRTEKPKAQDIPEFPDQPEQPPEIEPQREPEAQQGTHSKEEMSDEELRQMLRKVQNADRKKRDVSWNRQNQVRQNPAERLLQSRQRFRPFRDDEFTECVQIKLCDILPLQQEKWKVGRSNFLQHGYYLYRHLLLGRTKDGSYILGVPGTRNQQEEYMAQVFGYEHFKMAASGSCGRRFGYWYRIMEEPACNAEADIQLMQDYHEMKEKDAMA